jgi:hypothetical protein
VPGGSEDQAVITEFGVDLRISGPGTSSSFHISGHFLPDWTTYGLSNGFSDEGFARVCAALGH